MIVGESGRPLARSEGFLRSSSAIVDILIVAPWWIELSSENGFPFSKKKNVQIANPTSFLAQKILIHEERGRRDRAKDILYIHDTIEAFSGSLEELREIFANQIAGGLHPRRVRELKNAAGVLFASVNDIIREAALMALGRRLTAQAIIETGRAGLQEIFA